MRSRPSSAAPSSRDHKIIGVSLVRGLDTVLYSGLGHPFFYFRPDGSGAIPRRFSLPEAGIPTAGNLFPFSVGCIHLRAQSTWGIKVTAVEFRDVILADSMKGAMAGQAESERGRRAKIINAEAGFQAVQKLVQAVSMISAQPIALQLRFLQTMKDISSEHKTTTMLPISINLFGPFTKSSESQKPKGPSSACALTRWE